MGRFWTTPGQLSLLAALVPRLVQAQSRKALGGSGGGVGKRAPSWRPDSDPALLPPAVAQRKSWLVGLGAALALLFLIFVLTLVYAVWCRESQDRWVLIL